MFRGTWKKNAICPLQLKDKIDIFMKRYFIFKAPGLEWTRQINGLKDIQRKEIIDSGGQIVNKEP